MNRFDRFIIAIVLATVMTYVLRGGLSTFDPGVGRRPLAPTAPYIEQPPPPVPVPERVRRPPLAEPNARDPVFTVNTEAVPAGRVVLGTAFSVDPRGVWITARHVASEICQQLVVIVDGRPTPAAMAFPQPESDTAVLRTRGGAPALALTSARPAIGDTGFSFGYPTGILGATQDTLMGRTRMRFAGRLSGVTPTLTWAETSRFPDSLETLGGMSGGPMLDADGQVVGSVVAATTRRGRVHTVAPELLRQVERESGLADPAPGAVGVAEIVAPEPLSDIAKALSRDSRIAKVYCKPAA